MSTERTPLRLPSEVRSLVDQARGDIGLNTYLVRCVENQLIADGFMAERTTAVRENTVRARPKTASGWRR